MNLWRKIYQKSNMWYKVLLCLAIVFSIVHFFPRNSEFQYEFQKGGLWLYETLHAPFEFSLKKSAEEIVREKQQIKENSVTYYKKDSLVLPSVLVNYQKKATHYFERFPAEIRLQLLKEGEEFLRQIYDKGVLGVSHLKTPNIHLIQENYIDEVNANDFVHLKSVDDEVKQYFSSKVTDNQLNVYRSVFSEVVKPNILVNDTFTQKVLEQNLLEIVFAKEIVKKKQLIIARGEVIEGKKLQMLESLKAEYELRFLNNRDNKITYLGYLLLVSMVVFLTMLYLYRFRKDIYDNNSAITFLLGNILAMVAITSLIVNINSDYVYAIPLCMLPLLTKAFFDFRLGFFIHIMMLLLIGFIVPNSFQFVFTSIVACGSIILNIRSLHYRVSLFLTAGHITLVYVVTYFVYGAVSNESLQNFDWGMIGIFILNGFLILFVQPLTYVYEKMFGLVSNVSLLELSDTNSSLLKKLSEKAPGTFFHSLQVANLAEAAASKIGANSLLVRVGALYHDIGKLNNPACFTENQESLENPHDKLTPNQSAEVIIKHVADGIEIAKQYNIPQRIIDFISTHHGTTLVYYFYKKQIDMQGCCTEQEFRYPGPIPFSKETTILMMADSIEAASKSMKNPTREQIEELVETIIKKQLEDQQYINSDISLKDIEEVKRVFKEKLKNIHRLRIEYPK